MVALSETDKEILNMIQLDFPIDARPFQVLAKRLGLSEEDLIARVQAMKDLMIIRRIGGNFSPDRLGYYSTLCTAQVPENKIEEFTRTVNAYPGLPTITCGTMTSISGLLLSLLPGSRLPIAWKKYPGRPGYPPS